MSRQGTRNSPSQVFQVAVATILFFGLQVMAANATATLVVENGILMGARNLDIQDLGTFDVAFIDGRCADIFSPCTSASDFDFDNEADARKAGQALFDEVFIDVSPTLQFDSNQNLINGCQQDTVANRCTAIIPYGVEPITDPFVNVDFVAVRNYNAASGLSDILILGGIPAISDTSSVFPGGSLVYADFTPVGIPEPATGSILALGLLAIGAIRKRRLDRAARR